MATDCQLIATIEEYCGTEFHVDTQHDQELIVEALAQLYHIFRLIVRLPVNKETTYVSRTPTDSFES